MTDTVGVWEHVRNEALPDGWHVELYRHSSGIMRQDWRRTDPTLVQVADPPSWYYCPVCDKESVYSVSCSHVRLAVEGGGDE